MVGPTQIPTQGLANYYTRATKAKKDFYVFEPLQKKVKRYIFMTHEN